MRVSERRLKAEAGRIIAKLNDHSFFTAILEMNDPEYCQKRAVEELRSNVTSEFAIMLLLFAIILADEETLRKGN